MSVDHVEQDALRWYTPALRIPKFLGKLPSGERLPGGPYTQAQGAVFAVVVVAAGSTLQWWRPLLPEGQLWGLGAYLVVIVAALAAGLAARFAPRTSMNPLTILGGVVQQVRRGVGPDRRPWPRAVRGSITITAPAPAPVRAAAPARTAAAPSVTASRSAQPSRAVDAPSSAAPTSRSTGAQGHDGGSTATKLAALVAAAPGRSAGA